MDNWMIRLFEADRKRPRKRYQVDLGDDWSIGVDYEDGEAMLDQTASKEEMRRKPTADEKAKAKKFISAKYPEMKLKYIGF